MRYIAVREPGPPDVLVRGRRTAAAAEAGRGLDRGRVRGRRTVRTACSAPARYPPPPDASPIIGLEVAGRHRGTGRRRARCWNIGDEVCALTPGGGYAEYCATPAAFCLPLPPGLSLREAAGMPENYFTVWYNVFDRVHLARGRDRSSIHGGTSGIGLTAIQLAQGLRRDGLHDGRAATDKVAFCRDDGRRSRDRLQDAGLRRRSRRRITGKRGVDVVLDMVGGDYVERNLKCLGARRPACRRSAFLNGSRVNVDLHHVMLTAADGHRLDARARARCAAQGRARAQSLREEVWPLFAAAASCRS